MDGESRAREGLALPGGVRRDGRALDLPVTAAPLVGLCKVCGAKFYRGEELKWQAHVGPCARAHIDEIRAVVAERRKALAIFDESAWDPELAAHMRQVGKRMKAEGRLVVKKNERGGF